MKLTELKLSQLFYVESVADKKCTVEKLNCISKFYSVVKIGI